MPFLMWPFGGVSPQVRGSLRQACSVYVIQGCIPAGAGEPISALRAFFAYGVYPRRCGGARYGHYSLAAESGVSPQVRGSLYI